MLEENETFLRNEIFRRKKKYLEAYCKKRKRENSKKVEARRNVLTAKQIVTNTSMRFLCLANNYNPLLYLMVS